MMERDREREREREREEVVFEQNLINSLKERQMGNFFELLLPLDIDTSTREY